MEKEQEELMFKLSIFEQQMQQLQQQLQAVEHGIVEMNSLNLGLDELVGSRSKEIFASIGRGIFAKANLLSEDLIVDIGGKTFVKKNIPETKKMIQEQIKKLEEVQKELKDNSEKINREFMKLIEEAQAEQEKKKGK